MTRYLLPFIFLILTLNACKQQADHTRLFPNQAGLQANMDSILQKSDLPALAAIAINTQGERVQYTYGKAVWKEEALLSLDHIFRIASMTKLVTSIAALQLVEKDSIGLDQDLSLLMPEMTNIPILSDDGKLNQGETPITLRHLLTHNSGFGYSITDSGLSQHDMTDWNYEDYPRRFEAGTEFLYGTSTDWVGKLIEKITGQSLEVYFQQHITRPLGMSRTWFNVPDSLKQEIVSYGSRGNDGNQTLEEIPTRIPQEDTQIFSGGGGLFSSPNDYTKLLSCLLNEGSYGDINILRKETVEELFRPQFEGISMDIAGNYFLASFCCNFKDLISPTDNWGLGGLIDTEPTDYGRKAGTLLWGGLYNTYWYIDRQSGLAASIYSQHLPFNHPETTRIFEKFSEIVYQNYLE